MILKRSKNENAFSTISEENVSKIVDEKVLNRMTKLANNIRSISPKSDDFVYFSIIFLKAAESAILDENGNIKKIAGEKAWGYFDENWKWHGNVPPHRNNNYDIFPESELRKAASKWIGLPLCKDHESSSVDGVRGIILDTYYDEKFKQVVGLCALDKVNYPDLARKVQNGTVRYGSMGTAVENSICSKCQNIATTPQQYCTHIINKTAHGEINVGLKPIEYSLVVTPAEPGAVLLKCIASLKTYSNEFHNYGVGDVDNMLGKLSEQQAVHLDKIMKTACGDNGGCSIEKRSNIIRSFLSNNGLLKKSTETNSYKPEENNSNSYSEGKMQDSMFNEVSSDKLEDLNNSESSGISLNYPNTSEPLTTVGSKSKVNKIIKNKIKTILEDQIMNKERLQKRAALRRKNAYHQGGSEGVEPSTYKSEPYAFDHDKQMHQEFSGGDSGMVSGDKEVKEKLSRASLKRRALERRKVAYMQGGSEGREPGTYKSEPYSFDHDKQMHQEFSGGDSGMLPGDREIKEKLSRASNGLRGISKSASNTGLRTKMLIRKVAGRVDRENSLFQIFAGDKKVFEGTAKSIYGSELNKNWNWLTSKEYGQEVCKHIRASGLKSTINLLKNAQQEGAAPAATEAEPMLEEETEAMGQAPEMEAQGDLPELEDPDMEGDSDLEEEELAPAQQALDSLEEAEGLLANVKTLIEEMEAAAPAKNVEINVEVGDEGSESEVENLSALAKDVIGQLKTAFSELDDSADELAMVSSTYDNISKLSKRDRVSFVKLAKQAVLDGQKVISETKGISKIANKVKSMIKTSGDMSHYVSDEQEFMDALNMASDHAEDHGMDHMENHMKYDAEDHVNDADENDVADLEKAAMNLRRERRELLLKQAEAKLRRESLNRKVAMKEMELHAEDHGMDHMENDMKYHAEDHGMDHMKDHAEDHAEDDAEDDAMDHAFYAKDKMASIKRELSNKFNAKKASEEKENYKIKLRRAYDLALDMQKKGLLAGTKTALDKQVDEVMQFDDRAFESFKRTIANAKSVGTVKVASNLGGINVGIKDDNPPKKMLTQDLLKMMWDK